MIATILFYDCSSMPVVVLLHVTGVQSANLLITPRNKSRSERSKNMMLASSASPPCPRRGTTIRMVRPHVAGGGEERSLCTVVQNVGCDGCQVQYFHDPRAQGPRDLATLEKEPASSVAFTQSWPPDPLPRTPFSPIIVSSAVATPCGKT